jgi:hypothetical protein
LKLGTRNCAVIGEFHHVVKAPRRVIAPDVEDVHLAVVQAGDRLELADAFELALVGPLVLEAVAIDHLHRAEFTEDIAR